MSREAHDEERQRGYYEAQAAKTGIEIGDMRESVVVNPEAIGDLEQTPVVFVGADLRALLRPCRSCRGVNGFHDDGCASPAETGQVTNPDAGAHAATGSSR